MNVVKETKWYLQMILLSTEKTQVNQLEATSNNMHRREEASYKMKIQEQYFKIYA